MEISCVVTDKDLNEVARIEQIILHQPEYVLNGPSKSILTAFVLQISEISFDRMRLWDIY